MVSGDQSTWWPADVFPRLPPSGRRALLDHADLGRGVLAGRHERIQAGHYDGSSTITGFRRHRQSRRAAERHLEDAARERSERRDLVTAWRCRAVWVFPEQRLEPRTRRSERPTPCATPTTTSESPTPTCNRCRRSASTRRPSRTNASGPAMLMSLFDVFPYERLNSGLTRGRLCANGRLQHPAGVLRTPPELSGDRGRSPHPHGPDHERAFRSTPSSSFPPPARPSPACASNAPRRLGTGAVATGGGRARRRARRRRRRRLFGNCLMASQGISPGPPGDACKGGLPKIPPAPS